jgi:hypothetical protein
MLFSVATALVFALVRGGLTALSVPYFMLGILIYTLVFFLLMLPVKNLALIGLMLAKK